MRNKEVDMTAFTKENLSQDGTHLVYTGPKVPGSKTGFIARFKYTHNATFATFLRRNFTVEEYFDLYNQDIAPINILETKGYMSPNVKKALKRAGYPTTAEGKKAYIAAAILMREAADRAYG